MRLWISCVAAQKGRRLTRQPFYCMVLSRAPAGRGHSSRRMTRQGVPTAKLYGPYAAEDKIRSMAVSIRVSRPCRRSSTVGRQKTSGCTPTRWVISPSGV